MPSAPRPSSRSRQTWRERSQTGPAQAEAKRASRWMGSVLFLALLALFAWLVAPYFLSQSRPVFACLPVTDYDLQTVLTVPPVPFGANDVDAFRTAGIPSTSLQVWGKRRTMETLADPLNKIIDNPRDTLVLYVSAHGVSLDGNGYLLCSDFSDRFGSLGDASADQDTGRIEISRFLAQVKACQAARKVVILDAGHLATEPRLGMLVNEFPYYLAAAVARTRDPNLWVLTANGLDERSHVSHSQQRSVFNYYVVRGLAGEADAEPKDQVVDLAELSRYVASRVSDWVRRAEGENQTPQILWGGDESLSGDDGLTNFERKLQQVRFPINLELADAKAADDSTKPAAASDKSGAGSDKPGAGGSGGKGSGAVRRRAAFSSLALAGAALAAQDPPAGAGANTAAAPAQGAAAPPADGKKDDTPAAALTAPAKTEGDKANPSDAKPAASGAGAAAPAAPNTAPKDTPKAPPLPPVAPDLVELRDRWLERDKELTASWTPLDFVPHVWRAYENLVLDYELFLRAHGNSSAAGGAEKPANAKKEEPDARSAVTDRASRFALLRQTLIDRRQLAESDFRRSEAYSTLESESDVIRQAYKARNRAFDRAVDLVAWHGRANCGSRAQAQPQLYVSIQTFLRQLTELDRSLSSLDRPSDAVIADQQKKLDDAWKRIDEQLQAQVAQALQMKADVPSSVRWIDDLLSTPLLASDVRLRLIEALRNKAPRLDGVAATRSVPTIPLVDVLRLARLRNADQSVAEWAWSRAQEQAELEARLVDLANHDAAQRLAQPAAKADAIRSFGAALAKFYRDLPSAIEADTAKAGDDQTMLRRAERELRLVAVSTQNPIPRLRWATRGVEFQNIVPSDTLAFDESNRPQDLAGRVVAKGGYTGKVALRLHFNPQQIQVLRRADMAPVNPNEDQTATVDADHPFDFAYTVTRVNQQNQPGGALEEVKLEARLESGQIIAREIRGKLLESNRIKLAIHPVGKLKDAKLSQSAGEDGLQIFAFPDHDTTFEFTLQQFTKLPRKVKVKLLAVPVEDERRMRALRSQYETLHGQAELEDILDRASRRVLAESEETLPPGEAEHRIGLKRPAPPAPPAPAPGAAPAAAPTTPKPPESISGGLICKVEDSENKELKWITWIECQPWAPKEYVDPTIRYDSVTGKLTAEFAYSEAIAPTDHPISVSWELLKQGIPLASEEPSTELDRDNVTDGRYRNSLRASVARDNQQTVEVRLTVDGFPRAFVFRIRPDGSNPELRKADRSPLPFLEITKPKAQTVFATDPASLREPVNITVCVTVPEDCFLPGDRDQIEVGWKKQGNDDVMDSIAWSDFTEHRNSIGLKDISDEGRMTLTAKVEDYELALKRPPLNQKATLMARLALRNNREQVARVPLVFDSEPPKILNVAVKGKLILGMPATLLVTAQDNLSGVRAIAYRVDDANDEIDEKERKEAIEKTEQRVAPSGKDQVTYQITWPEPKEGNQKILLWATDMAGLNSSAESFSFTVPEFTKMEKAADGKPAPPKLATIKGKVTYGGTGIKGITVTLEGGKSAKTTEDGSFSIPEVAPGSYKLQAEGIAKNSNRKGDSSIVVAAGKDPSPIELKLK